MFEIYTYSGYNVDVTAGGSPIEITSNNHPLSANANIEVPWYLVGHVVSTIDGPAVGYVYEDGPADAITIIRKDGSTVSIAKGYAAVSYLSGSRAACISIDSRDNYKGVIFPIPGTYWVWLAAGRYYV